MNSKSDQEIISLCIEGDNNAWREFLLRFSRVINFSISKILSNSGHTNKNERDDIFQHIFLSLIENDYSRLKSYEGRASFSSYLSVVSYRIAIDYLRSKKTSKKTILASELPSEENEDWWIENYSKKYYDSQGDAGENYHTLAKIRESISKLPPREKIIITLILEGFEYKEIAEKINIPIGTVSRTIHDIRSKLKG